MLHCNSGNIYLSPETTFEELTQDWDKRLFSLCSLGGKADKTIFLSYKHNFPHFQKLQV